jgi:hypothetical protein
MNKSRHVQRNPEYEQDRLNTNKRPTAHYSRELVGDALTASQFLRVNLINVLDGLVVVAMPDPLPFPFFDCA